MPLPSLQQSFSTSQAKSIHLLRALLRESSYLPDANARSFFHTYILNRFRAYQPNPKARNTNRIKKKAISNPDARLSHVQRTAYKGLNLLRRANNGEPRPLWKVLLMAYGRIGKRRFDLLDNLLQKPGAASTEETLASAPTELAPLEGMYHSNKAWLKFFDAPKERLKGKYTISISNRYPRLKVVLTTQVQNRVALGRSMKRAFLETPINNIWERPMPIKRARNDVRRWYAFTMSRLLPHLPTEEWDTLHAMVIGEKRWKDRVVRRTPAGTNALSEEDHSLAVIDAGIRMDRLTKADMRCGQYDQHRITSHMMRRLYAKILSMSCKLKFDEARNRWEAQWGSFSHLGLSSMVVPVDDALFAGVTHKGTLLESPRKRPR
ncbi:hypothetical protein B0J11DRAFT_263563 [Dendryphion nanum]|uniref:LYR motif-containing protein Cup1-like N-terminal domain-containing protein n=1 Tax=Dendryphion nanum TaxID=256645 RepID=A0A9P9DZZ0_9PLEO|nr:hypothetical protein B0J11DRAFT_263563 [Dendryphion nanum]